MEHTLDSRLLTVALASALCATSLLSTASAQAEDFVAYEERVPGTDAAISMIPLTGGTFTMGSPADEPGRSAAEGPQHDVTVGDFWIGQFEITWQQYRVFVYRDADFAEFESRERLQALGIDEVTGASTPYSLQGMGDRALEQHPAGHITQHAALGYARWLSAKTGRFYRLPTEAEWEYACRAGTTTAWSFSDNPAAAADHGVFAANSEYRSAPVGSRAPNPWQLYDMHGNVAEWTMDQYDPGFYAGSPVDNPWNRPVALFPRIVRGGSWAHDAGAMRCAARMRSDTSWKRTDPQIPRSPWWLTDAPFVGFRLVRPRVQPSPEEAARYWLEAIEDYGD